MMQKYSPRNASPPRSPLWMRAVVLVAAGLPGVAMLALQPIPQDWLQVQPELQLWPAWALQALLMLNPLILLVLAAWCGALITDRVGLYSVLAGTASPESRRNGWGLASAVGMCTGVALVVLDRLAAPWLGEPWAHFLQQGSKPSILALGTGILYGGITEEIIMRWGLMGCLTWALWSLTGRRHPAPALVVAAVVTAGVFGAGHLPVLATQVELTPAVVARTVAVNALAALVYAWMFWRHHLEAAMLCHACTHAGMGAVWALS